MAKKTAAKSKAANSLQRQSFPQEEDRSVASTKRNGSPTARQTTTNGSSSTSIKTNGTHSNDKKQEKLQQDNHSNKTKSNKLVILLRSILLDIPLLLLFSLYVSVVVLHHVHDEYLVPQAESMSWTEDRKTPEMTYYDRTCSVKDISTNTTDDLVILPKYTPTNCMHHVAQHGVSLYPSILKEETANELRDWILERNKLEEGFWVISGEHRFTFGIGVNQAPIVSQALEEIATHTVFRPAIDEICGENPAVIEFTAITSEYGASDQFWHQDTLPIGSTIKHARSFVPSYSLFIPLQDTTAEIGATEICPGSHVCNGQDHFCVEGGFRASGEEGGVWPKATGALVNQHLYHRGMAHTDPNGLDRVLFILTFAPRPRTEKGQVETRLISMGGSYSLNWRQWGHTLDDFGNAPTAMKEPWKTMRSLGIYKPKDADWGWDMPAVASMRIVNDDNGYHFGDLEDWLEDKGGFGFIPKSLQAEIDEDEGWPGFLKTTLVNCEKASERVYFLASGVYLILFLSVTLFQRLSGGKRAGGSPFGRAVIRIVLTHAVVVALACYAVYLVAKTPWAENINQGRQFTLPARDIESLPSDMLPGTLPYKRDVLVETKYDSEYLAGTNYIIENAHPGNVDFKETLVKNSVGYQGLSPTLQAQLTSDVVDWVGQDFGRFLSPNEEGNWAEMSLPDAQKVVHKGFIKETNPLVAKVLTELAYLLSETKFGIFRDKAIHRRHIPDLLEKLQDRILDPPPFVTKNNKSVTTTPSSSSGSMSGGPSSLSVSEAPALRERVAPVERQSLPPVYIVAQPYPGAWSQEGDVVEAKYNGVHNEWYRATIVDMSVDSSTYDVQYDDGELDEDLCRLCIRPYEELKLNEEVGVREEDADVWYNGRVVKVHADGTVDIDAGEDGMFENVDASFTRRSDPEPEIQLGSRVQAMYQRGGTWYDGFVQKIRPDMTFDIVYDDGDIEYRVKRKFVRGVA